MMDIYEIRFTHRTWDSIVKSGEVRLFGTSIRVAKNYAKQLERDGHWDIAIWKTSVKLGFGDGTVEEYTQVN